MKETVHHHKGHRDAPVSAQANLVRAIHHYVNSGGPPEQKHHRASVVQLAAAGGVLVSTVAGADNLHASQG